MTFSACKRDKCKKVSCTNGECVDGECLCPSGYEGPNCTEAVNAKFTGTFTVDESCTAGDDDYELVIRVAEGSLKGLEIDGLWDRPNGTVEAVVADDGLNLSIARQAYEGYEIEGEGTIGASFESGNVTYRIYPTGSGTPLDECELSYQ